MDFKDKDELIFHFRRFKESDSLERVVSRLLDKTTDVKCLADIFLAADHRRAELAANKLFTPGQLPTWALKLI